MALFDDKYFTFDDVSKTLIFKSDACDIVQTMVPGDIRNSAKNVVIPDGIQSIGSLAFSHWSNLDCVVISDSVQRIRFRAFNQCRNLKDITFGRGIKVIEDNCFHECSALKNVYIENLSSWCKIDFQSKFASPLIYGAKLYLDYNPVIDLTIPDNISQISTYAFAGCKSIKSVIIPDSIKKIGLGAFCNCPKLERVKMCNGVETIDIWAFYNCVSLKYMNLPDSIEHIGYKALETNSRNIKIRCKKTAYLKQWSEKNNVNCSISKIDDFVNSIDITDSINNPKGI